MRLEFALTEEQFREVLRVLFDRREDNDDPERGFLALIFPATGLERRTLILGRVVEPAPGEVSWSYRRRLQMSHGYYSRALNIVQSTPGAGLINIHSHPHPKTNFAPPEPSTPDLNSDRTELCFASRILGADRSVAAGIVTPGGGISVREYRFQHPKTTEEAISPEYGPEGGKYCFANRIRIVGPGIRVQPGDPEEAAGAGPVDLSTTESSALLWGEAGQKILSGLSVGIAGLGGVGGMLAEHVARLGVGRLILVDYDRLEEANLNRSQGANRQDMRSRVPKVDLYSRIAAESATAPNFSVSKYRASVVETEGLEPLLDCDLILAAADDACARQVLDHAAYAHLIPVIDCGTELIGNPKTMKLDAGKSQVVSAGPGHACLECQRVYTQEEATVARESATWGRYLEMAGNETPDVFSETRAPSVISCNAMVAGLMGLRLLALALRLTPETMQGTQRYYIEEGVLQWAAVRECTENCRKSSWVGHGDIHWIPVGTDLRWKKIREQELL